MDARAYLHSQGWRGDGHSLDQTNQGLKKPLLVSKKVDVLGVGLNKHAAVSDQWWLRAFDEGLKNLGKGGNTLLGSVQKHGIKNGGLYGRFVKGDGVPGTIGQSSIESTPVGTVTPADKEEKAVQDMTMEIPPPGQPEDSVDATAGGNDQAALQPSAQELEKAATEAAAILDRKRKRPERPAEKRARRKIERGEQAKEHAAANQERAKEDGTWNVEAEQERQRQEDIDRRVRRLVQEAEKRGVLGPSFRPEKHSGTVATPQASYDDILQIATNAGIDPHSSAPVQEPSKSQKYNTERMRRAFKRSARAYITGGDPLDATQKQGKPHKTPRSKDDANCQEV